MAHLRVFTFVSLIKVLLLCLITAHPICAKTTGGFPFHYNFTGNDYKSTPQNWSFYQDDDGLIYIANSGGVLIYDGSRWSKVLLDRERPARSLVAGEDGNIYAFGVGEFGKITVDSLGSFMYKSLIETLPDTLEAGNIWDAAVADDGVYFRTYEALYRWDYESVTAWHAGENQRFGRLFSFRGKPLVFHGSKGLMTIEGEEAVVILEETNTLSAVFLFAPMDENTVIAGFQNHGFYRFEFGETISDVRFENIETDLDPFIQDVIFYRAMLMQNGNVAIATINGGVLVMSPEGRLEEQITVQEGLRTNMVLNVGEDMEGGLWALTNNGLTRFDFGNPSRYWNQEGGLPGSILSVKHYNGTLYAGTSNGLYYLEKTTLSENSDEFTSYDQILPRSHFRRVYGSEDGQTWDFIAINEVIESTKEGFIVAGLREYLYYISEGQRPRVIPDSEQRSSFFSLIKSRFHPNTFFAGGDRGVLVVTVNPDLFNNNRYEEAFTVTMIPLGSMDIRSLKEDNLGYLWLGDRFDSIGRLDVRDDPHRSDAPLYVFTEEEHTPVTTRGHFISSLCGDRIGIASNQGLFVLDESYQRIHEEEYLPDTIFKREERVEAMFYPDKADAGLFVDFPGECREMWIYNRMNVSRLIKEEGNWTENSYVLPRNLFLSLYNFYVDPQENVWIGGDEFLYVHDRAEVAVQSPGFRTIIRSIYGTEERLLIEQSSLASRILDRQEAQHIILPFSDNRLRFQFSATSFHHPEGLQYQVRLKGFEEEWSAWSSLDFREYTNLREGEYVFQVRSRNDFHVLGEADEIRVTIMAPWYRSPFAWILYILSGAIGIALLLKWRTSYLRAKNIQLELSVAERTFELENEKEKLKRANIVLSRFMSIAAHDLRNPVGVITSYADMLEAEKEDPEAVAEYSVLIRSSGNRVMRLLDDLVNFKRISGNEMELKMEHLDIASLLQNIGKEYQIIFQSKEQKLDIRTPKGCTVKTDPEKIRSIIENLLTNASKYTPKGGEIRLEAACCSDQDRLTITISDNGQGFSEEDLELLFKEFQTLSSRPTGGEGSTGLGLYIVKNLIDIIGAEIEVESEKKKGTTFRVHLPCSSEGKTKCGS
ncbi:ATP-binding protein [Balneolaceae bacterium ANBcel3]|nr:ATP-binding protein [Balneolaceae bacterium ANBcel3]